MRSARSGTTRREGRAAGAGPGRLVCRWDAPRPGRRCPGSQARWTRLPGAGPTRARDWAQQSGPVRLVCDAESRHADAGVRPVVRQDGNHLARCDVPGGRPRPLRGDLRDVCSGPCWALIEWKASGALGWVSPQPGGARCVSKPSSVALGGRRRVRAQRCGRRPAVCAREAGICLRGASLPRGAQFSAGNLGRRVRLDGPRFLLGAWTFACCSVQGVRIVVPPGASYCSVRAVSARIGRWQAGS